MPENISQIQVFSEFAIYVINLFEDRIDTGFLKIHKDVNLDDFSGIVIHNSVSYNVDNLKSLDLLIKRKLVDYKGIKVMFKQDENYRHQEIAEFIGYTGFDIIFTCLPNDEVEKIYPRNVVGENPRFVHMLTGYITPYLRSDVNFQCERKIDIGYRGSIQPLSFGRLAYEKRKIGNDISDLLAGRGYQLDISSKEEDRKNGSDWFEFLASCKATLGVESGASVFDLNNDLLQRCSKAERKLGGFQENSTYAEEYLSYIDGLENNIVYGQVSPRHFEAIATKTLQLLYPGRYSDALKSGCHFFPLARDYSNIELALETLRDDKLRSEITDRAYEEVVLNKSYWIETFVKQFDEEVNSILTKLYSSDFIRTGIRNEAQINVLLMVAHQPFCDPRCDWMALAAPSDIHVHQLGISRIEGAPPERSCTENGDVTWIYPRMQLDSDVALLKSYLAIKNPSPGFAELLNLYSITHLSDDDFSHALNIPEESLRLDQFRWSLKYILNMSITLIHHASKLQGLNAIIATDLDTLPAAIILKDLFDIPVIYDAHEFWPEADINQDEFEKEYWIGLERRMLKYVNVAQTVSPQLAVLMGNKYECEFETVPNAEPVESAISENKIRSPTSSVLSNHCSFLFQGGFAPGRGINLLIQAWPETMACAILELRGPDNPYKEEMVMLAKSVGLYGTRIIFLEPVVESALVEAAAKSDVGVIPYESIGLNYANCCPNKLSQYMAAGLPILANKTNFIEQLVIKAQCGSVVEFNDRKSLVASVNYIAKNVKIRREQGLAGYSYFCEYFNWQVVSKSVYSNIKSLIYGAERQKLVECDMAQLVFDAPPTFSLINHKRRLFTPMGILRKLWRVAPVGFRCRVGPYVRRVLRNWNLE